MAKLTDKDYLYEGLRICISWFEKVLEGTATSHNIGTNQALTGKLTSRGSKNASDLRRKLLETFEEIERNVLAGEAEKLPRVPSMSKLTKEAMQAQQVFKGSANSFGLPTKKQ